MNPNNELELNIYELRMLVFIETEPQSNQYRQVALDKEQYKKVSEILSRVVFQEGDYQECENKCLDEVHTLPDLIAIHD